MASVEQTSEQARQAQDARLVVDTIPALAWSARADGSADFFNQRWLDYTGLSAEQARDWGWTVAVHPDDLNVLVDYWRSILVSGEPGQLKDAYDSSMACIAGFFSARLRRWTAMQGLSDGSERTPTSKIENARNCC
jgi:PAS domain-containing protein